MKADNNKFKKLKIMNKNYSISQNDYQFITCNSSNFN